MFQHEKRSHSHWLARACALLLCLTVTLSGLAAAAVPVPTPSCDEAYYATLDYYGNLLEGSVVKSYQLNGSTSLVDYGAYDEVRNLTDGRSPAVEDGSLSFDVSDSPDGRFYFEGKTDRPYASLPWTIAVSYRLNGVDTPAEELAGKTGEVEIHIDAVPNRRASEYARNNFALEAAAVFSADDILSLEAPGAQIQLLGNLRAVLFMALPGQEEHFVIRVGSDDFTFSGLTFLLQPVTLMQLDDLGQLRDARDDIEDSYHDLDDSLSAILDALDGMSGSLNATADGLDQLNTARGQISDGKGYVYNQADAALAGLTGMVNAMQPVSGYLDTASKALTDTTAVVNDMHGTVQELKPRLQETRELITKTQEDLKKLQTLLTSLEKDGDEVRDALEALRDDGEDLEGYFDAIQNDLTRLNRNLKAIQSSKLSYLNGVTIGGASFDQIQENLPKAQSLETAYNATGAALHCGSYTDYAELMLLAEGIGKAMDPPVDAQTAVTAIAQQAAAAGITPLAVAETMAGGADSQSVQAAKTGAQQLNTLLTASKDPSFSSQMNQAQVINTMIGSASTQAAKGSVNNTINEVNAMLTGLIGPTTSLLDEVDDLMDDLSDDYRDDLDDLLDGLGASMDTVSAHKGEGSQLIDDAKEVGDLLTQLTETGDRLLTSLDRCNEIFNTYEPTLQSALQDSKTLADSGTACITSLRNCLKAMEELLKKSGTNLDAGTQQSLSGLAETLRKATVGLEETDSMRDARDIITGHVEEQWDNYTGEDNNLLLVDSQAPMVSLTSENNPSPTSVQVIMRTQEIEEAQASIAEEHPEQPQQEQGGFWHRVAQMFKALWHTLTGWIR